MINSMKNKQREVFNFYRSFIERNGFSPTYAAASKELGIKESVIFTHIKNLCDKGYLTKNSEGAIFIAGKDQEQQYLDEIESLKKENTRLNSVIDVLLSKLK